MAEKMEKDAAELPGISREAEEHHLAYVIGVAQEHLVQARKAIREANEDLADLMEVYEVMKKNQYGQYLKDVMDGKYQEHLY